MSQDSIAANTNYEGPRFHTILVDPPWDIHQVGRLGANQHYDLLNLEQIKRLPVGEIAEDPAHLYLWVTNAVIRHGYDVAEAWGFTVKSVITWAKPRFTLGQYVRNQTEHILFAVRGKAPVQFRGQGSLIWAPLMEHSRKPDEQYSIIERLSGSGPKVELFARRRPPETPGSPWSVWGMEIDSDISIPGFPVPSDLDDQEVGGK